MAKTRHNTGGTAGEYLTLAADAAAMIRDCTSVKPRWAVVLGSGLSSIADTLDGKIIFPYSCLPGMRPAGVAGHPGRLVFGSLNGVSIAAFQGRSHLYEGFGSPACLAHIRLAAELRIRNIVITNAAGGISPRLAPGNLMPVSSHINLTFSPGTGLPPAATRSGALYSELFLRLFTDAARRAGAFCAPGVYAQLPGPCYETPAEVRALRALGADAVGMSTAIETTEASRAGMNVLAVSCITNSARAHPSDAPGPCHDEVLAAAIKASSKLIEILNIFFALEKET